MPAFVDFEWTTALFPAAGACARTAAAVAVGTLPLGSIVPPRVRVALAVALSLVVLPRALAAPGAGCGPLGILSEAVIGTGLGLVVAACCAASAWAGVLVGSVTGLTWADDFAPDGDAQAAGLARLTWWLGLAAFFATGGHLAAVSGLVDSFRAVPPGSAPQAVAATVVAVPGLALDLALRFAAPALVAVITFHLGAAVCLRIVRFAPGAGLLQAVAAMVALGVVIAGLPAWIDGVGTAARGRVAHALDGGRPAPP